MWLSGYVAMWLSYKNLKVQKLHFFRSWIFKVLTVFKVFQSLERRKFQHFKSLDIKFQNFKSSVHRLSQKHKKVDCQIYKHHISQKGLHTFLVFWSNLAYKNPEIRVPRGSNIQKSWNVEVLVPHIIEPTFY